jgi:hypothetical protein
MAGIAYAFALQLLATSLHQSAAWGHLATGLVKLFA